MLHHVDEQGEGEDEGLEPLAERTEPVGHDEDAAEDAVDAALLLPDLQGAVRLVAVVVHQVDVDPHHREQRLAQDDADTLLVRRVRGGVELHLRVQQLEQPLQSLHELLLLRLHRPPVLD